MAQHNTVIKTCLICFKRITVKLINTIPSSKPHIPFAILQDAHYKGAAKLGHGTGYKYAHDYPNHYVEQQYLPYELDGKEFYHPSGNGYEVKVKEHMRWIKKQKETKKNEF